MKNTRFLLNRKRDLRSELSLWHPLFLQNYYLINDIKYYLKKIAGNTTLVDIGCGTKPYKDYVDKTVKYIGVDLDSANDNVDLISSAYSINLKSENADYVISFQVLEHLEEPLLMLKEACRILKIGGEICITFPMSEHLHEEPYDFFRYTEHGISYLLRSAGFNKIKIIRQGTNYANIGRRLAQLISGKRILNLSVPLINFIFMKLENRKGCDVMNYMVIAKKII